MRSIDRIIVHHTVTDEDVTVAQIDAIHMQKFGRTMQYHWLIHRAESEGVWTVSAGWPEAEVSWHDKGENSTSIGICIAGRYHEGPVYPHGWAVLLATVANRIEHYDLPVAKVYGHKENEEAGSGTLCPGFDPDDLRRDLRAEETPDPPAEPLGPPARPRGIGRLFKRR